MSRHIDYNWSEAVLEDSCTLFSPVGNATGAAEAVDPYGVFVVQVWCVCVRELVSSQLAEYEETLPSTV